MQIDTDDISYVYDEKTKKWTAFQKVHSEPLDKLLSGEVTVVSSRIQRLQIDAIKTQAVERRLTAHYINVTSYGGVIPTTSQRITFSKYQFSLDEAGGILNVIGVRQVNSGERRELEARRRKREKMKLKQDKRLYEELKARFEKV